MKIRYNWYSNYCATKDYYDNYNKFPDYNTVYKGKKIGEWFKTQKMIIQNAKLNKNNQLEYRRYVYDKEKIDLMNEISKDWYKSSWELKYDILSDFYKKNKRLPRVKENYKDVNIGAWLTEQKKAYNNGKYVKDGIKYNGKTLTNEQIEKLFNVSKYWYKDFWFYSYEILLNYIKEYNRFPTSKESYKDMKIGMWLCAQRTVYNKGTMLDNGILKFGNHYLTKEQILLLEKIDFLNVEFGRTDSFDIYYPLLKEYSEKNGKYLGYKTIYKDKDIGLWFFRQKNIIINGEELEDGTLRYNYNYLTKDHLNKLLDLKINILNQNYKFLKRKIENVDELKKKRRVLEILLNNNLDNYNNIDSMEDIKNINNSMIKSLNIKSINKNS